MAARTSRPGWTAPAIWKRAASTPPSRSPSTDAGFTKDAPGFEGEGSVIDDKGKKGDANEAVITALIEADMLFARGRLKHTYPHSWRSKKPVIFRNTPQWFVYMDKDRSFRRRYDTLRSRALKAIDDTRFVPKPGRTACAA
jgi:isoleucyl-tRNA synthetase